MRLYPEVNAVNFSLKLLGSYIWSTPPRWQDDGNNCFRADGSNSLFTVNDAYYRGLKYCVIKY